MDSDGRRVQWQPWLQRCHLAMAWCRASIRLASETCQVALEPVRRTASFWFGPAALLPFLFDFLCELRLLHQTNGRARWKGLRGPALRVGHNRLFTLNSFLPGCPECWGHHLFLDFPVPHAKIIMVLCLIARLNEL